MAEYNNLYKTEFAENANGSVEQLLQLLRLTYSGDLVNKTITQELKKSGYAIEFHNGWHLITPEGVLVLENLGLIRP